VLYSCTLRVSLIGVFLQKLGVAGRRLSGSLFDGLTGKSVTGEDIGDDALPTSVETGASVAARPESRGSRLQCQSVRIIRRRGIVTCDPISPSSGSIYVAHSISINSNVSTCGIVLLQRRSSGSILERFVLKSMMNCRWICGLFDRSRKTSS
jgi:hypothetical protein